MIDRRCALARSRATRSGLAVALIAGGVAGSQAARGDDFNNRISPGNLLVSRSVYDNDPNNVVAGVTLLPPNCVGSACAAANAGGTYPEVFNNDLVDGSFGITSKIVLDQLTTSGSLINSIEVPNSSQHGIERNSDQMVTSFSSKSELALNLSTDHSTLTFMGYLAPVDALDASNSNTPGVVDPTNPVNQSVYRVVGELDQHGHFRFTKTNAYSGNNGRAAIMNGYGVSPVVYTAGNAGNGSNPQPNGVIIGAGAQILAFANTPLVAQSPGDPTPVGSFNVTQLGLPSDKIGKDTNFRGLTIFNNVIYMTKGSGSNGINTVYFIDTSGFNANQQPLACPNGVGVPSATATLPTSPIFYDANLLQTEGVFPYNMCILNGFPTGLAKKDTSTFPFGLWFADAHTLYVADEGNGTNTYDPSTNSYTAAAAQTMAGLQKWVFNGSTWSLAYVLQTGLQLGTPYTVAGYPTGNNPATGLPWSPATDGLRNLTGRVNGDGTVTIWAITSTVSGGGDQGADPNKLVRITDKLSASGLPAGESFNTVESAGFAEVLRGVSFTPGTPTLTN
ncbi:MAG TPA: hypothetical protein VGJ20_00325 [Xanthobacteraceae bacterium]